MSKPRAFLFYFLLVLPLTTYPSPIAFAFYSATNHIVISEVQSDGSGGAPDAFVELYNSARFDIDLQSLPLKLHIGNSAGTDSNNPLTFTNTVIPGRRYFLMGTSSYTGTGSVTLDATYSD